MDSHPTGSPNRPIDLVRIETNLFDVFIKGKPFHPTVEILHLHRSKEAWVDAQFQAHAGRGIQLEQIHVFSHEQGELVPWWEGLQSEPLFFENQSYQIVIEKKQDIELSFYHSNIHLREAVGPLGKSVLTGVLNFRNDVGYSEFEVRYKGHAALKVQLEIFPSKLDYRKDYHIIMQDVNDQIYNLAFDFMRRTFQQTGLRHAQQPSLTEFFTILKSIFQQLIDTLDRMKNTPHYMMQEHQRLRDASRVKKAGKRNIAFLRKHPHMLREDTASGWLHIQGRPYQPQKLLESKRYVQYDTNENRFVRWMLLRIEQQLKRIRKLLTQYRQPDPLLLRGLDHMSMQMKRMLQLDFLQVGELKQISISLVLQMAPGYREVYRYYLMLMKGLSLHNDLFRLSMKDIAQLYEYWCFLKIHHLLNQKYKLLQQNVIKVQRSGLFVTLDQSRSAKMKYQNPKNGEIFTLYYNAVPQDDRQFPTLPQRPDNVLTLKKQESSVVYKYVFDAKYRLNPAEEGTWYHRQYSHPGPQEDDINTMHRYRDAIVYAEKNAVSNKEYERSMFGAYVLFPYGDEERFKEHRFYKSIKLINIGAFPFLPNATKLLEDFLDEIIKDSPEKAYERTTRPRGTREYYANYFVGKNILIGSLRGAEQLDDAMKHRFYLTPLENISDHKLLTQLEYVGIYQSIRFFGNQHAGIRWYGKIKSWKVVKREEITERPFAEKNRSKLYVRFEIEEWLQKEQPVLPNGIGIRNLWYASYYIFTRAHELAELKLESEQELREWRELRREGVVRVELDHRYIDLARRVTGMRVE